MNTKGSKELRKGRISSGTVPIFVTICSYERQIISKKTVFKALRIALGWLETNGYIRLFCFILMPDHVHIVFQLAGDKDLSEVISNLKISVYKQLKLNIGTRKFWQQGFFDHRIRGNEQFMQIIYYCYNNPHTAGTISEDKKYPFWYCESKIQDELDRRIDFYKKQDIEGNGFNPRQVRS